jgi:hypothetical protein
MVVPDPFPEQFLRPIPDQFPQRPAGLGPGADDALVNPVVDHLPTFRIIGPFADRLAEQFPELASPPNQPFQERSKEKCVHLKISREG